jgi:hypothetical protein
MTDYRRRLEAGEFAPPEPEEEPVKRSSKRAARKQTTPDPDPGTATPPDEGGDEDE